MSWKEIDAEHLLKAMTYIEEVGIDHARAALNVEEPAVPYHRARYMYVYYHQQGPFELRPLVAHAHRLQFPEALLLTPLDMTNFSRGHATMKKWLKAIGIDLRFQTK